MDGLTLNAPVVKRSSGGHHAAMHIVRSSFKLYVLRRAVTLSLKYNLANTKQHTKIIIEVA